MPAASGGVAGIFTESPGIQREQEGMFVVGMILLNMLLMLLSFATYMAIRHFSRFPRLDQTMQYVSIIGSYVLNIMIALQTVMLFFLPPFHIYLFTLLYVAIVAAVATYAVSRYAARSTTWNNYHLRHSLVQGFASSMGVDVGQRDNRATAAEATMRQEPTTPDSQDTTDSPSTGTHYATAAKKSRASSQQSTQHRTKHSKEAQ